MLVMFKIDIIGSIGVLAMCFEIRFVLIVSVHVSIKFDFKMSSFLISILKSKILDFKNCLWRCVLLVARSPRGVGASTNVGAQWLTTVAPSTVAPTTAAVTGSTTGDGVTKPKG